MILTLTLNPAIDKSTEVQQMIPEKKMRCPEILMESGGGGINVSKAILELGGSSLAVFPYGGMNGEMLLQLMAEKKIEVKPIKIASGTRESFSAFEKSTSRQFRFVMPGGNITGDEIEKIKKAICEIPGATYLVCSGSLPPGVPVGILGEFAVLAKKNNIRLIIDTSGDALKAAVKEGVYLLKPNVNELGSLVGKDYLELSAIEDAALEIIESGSCEVMVVSMGPSGAMLVTKDCVKNFAAPLVKKLSTVGAGDSMVAGITWMLEQGKSLEEAVQFGIACGTAATITKGTELFHKADALRFYDWIRKKN